MADKKLTDLPAATALTDDDIAVLVDSPGGGAATKKMTVASLRAELLKGTPYPIELNLNEGGGVLQTGDKSLVHIQAPGTITNWYDVSDHSTGIALEVWRAVGISGLNSFARLFAMGHSLTRWGTGAPAAAVALNDFLKIVNVKCDTITQDLVSIIVMRT